MALTTCYYNIWGGRQRKELDQFFRKHPLVDVYLLTEVTRTLGTQYKPGTRCRRSTSSPNSLPPFLNAYEHIVEHLGDTYDIEYVAPRRETWQCLDTGGTFTDIGFGSVIASRKGLSKLPSEYKVLPQLPGTESARVLQWIIVCVDGQYYLLVHFHGLWLRDNGKRDDIETGFRRHQSLAVRRIISEVADHWHVDKIVLGGDFNLELGTKALRKLEERLFTNLIKLYGVKSTRTELYRYHGKPGKTMDADHVLVTPNVAVHEFLVDTGEPASNHAPLFATFS